jgi:uncharacterized protein (TIGR02246 family)
MKGLQISLPVMLLALPFPAISGPAEDANAILDKWAAAYSANNPEAVLKLYTKDATLLGTVSPNIASTPEKRAEYFERLPGSGNKAQVSERHTEVLSETAVLITGFYDFTVMQDGQLVPMPNRYTILVVKQGNDWLISHHHSSFRPKSSQ